MIVYKEKITTGCLFFKASTKEIITLDQFNSRDTAAVVLVVEKKEGYRQSR
ncbi:MAG: hypothetical protein JSW12_16085 [Deltaproteobacteria bacterium]|nr:MAG: hypothetical protein JSW12_16085 [Deltaproteobacteria bacterium]